LKVPNATVYRVANLRLLLPALWALTAGPAWAGWEAGVGFDLAKDLGDAGLDLPTTDMGMGPVLRAPTRYRFSDKVALRGEIGLGMSWGSDHVEWLAYEEMVPVYSNDHATTLTTVGLLVGPEVSPWPKAAASPYLGTEAGVMWARHWHRFEGQEERLMGLAGGGDGIHPYTTQMTPVLDLHGGLRFQLPGTLAIEVESGYNVAFMRKARLAQAPPELEAVRTAYGLNQLRFGLNLVIPLATGSES